MLTIYTIVLFIHISAALVWLGGGIVMEFIHLRMGHTVTRAQLKEFFALGAWLSPRLFMPAALLTLFSGMTVVHFSTKTHFGDFTVVYAIAAVIVAMVLGGAGIGRITRKLVGMIDDPSASQQEINANLQKLRFFSNLDLAILITVLFDVTTEPAWSSYPWMVVVAVFLLAVAVYNLAYTPNIQTR